MTEPTERDHEIAQEARERFRRGEGVLLEELLAAAREEGRREERERCASLFSPDYVFSGYPDLQSAAKTAIALYRERIRSGE